MLRNFLQLQWAMNEEKGDELDCCGIVGSCWVQLWNEKGPVRIMQLVRDGATLGPAPLPEQSRTERDTKGGECLYVRDYSSF